MNVKKLEILSDLDIVRLSLSQLSRIILVKDDVKDVIKQLEEVKEKLEKELKGK